MQQSNARTHVDVSVDDLPVQCPTADSSLWNSHPRVFIPLEDAPEATCPYCGTLFRLVDKNSRSVTSEALSDGTEGAVEG